MWYDWFKDRDGTYQYDPKVHSQKDLQSGQEYIGKSFSGNSANYRNDGSIMFTNETSAYKRMWSQANDHYKQGKEVGAFTLENGNVLVYPDYDNEKHDCAPTKYGYTITKDKYLSIDNKYVGKNKYKITVQIHTHQSPGWDPTPSFYTGTGWGDVGYSKYMGGLPIMTIGHDGKVYGAYWGMKGGGYSHFDIGSRADLLSGRLKLTPWLNTYPTKNE